LRLLLFGARGGHHRVMLFLEAQRVAALFKAHDERLVRESAPHALDQRKLIEITRRARAEIATVLAQDVGEAPRDPDAPVHEAGGEPSPLARPSPRPAGIDSDAV
jgi:hypothetical protein